MTISEAGPLMKRLLQLSSYEAGKCLDLQMSMLKGKFVINILVLDDILHERHGHYEQEHKSMSDCIKKYYGEEAEKFVETNL